MMGDPWVRLRLGDIATRVTDKNKTGIDRVLTVSSNHGLVEQELYFTRRVASRDVSGYTLVSPKDYVYNKSYSADAPIGVVARNHSECVGVVSPLYIVFRVNSAAVVDGFLDHAVESRTFADSLRGLLKEGARAHGALNVRVSDFFTAQVDLPPSSVQRRIVDLLNAVDTHITNLDYERDEAGRLLTNLRRELLLSSEGWARISLSVLVESLDFLRRPVKSSDRQAGPYPYYGASGIVDHVNDWLIEGESLLVSEDGANLRARTSPIAFCVDGRYWVNNHAHVLRAINGNSNRFLAHLLETVDIDRALTGTTMPKLNAGNLLGFEVAVPPTALQHELAALLDSAAANRDRLGEEADALRLLRSHLLQVLLSRGVDVLETYDVLLDAGVSA